MSCHPQSSKRPEHLDECACGVAWRHWLFLLGVCCATQWSSGALRSFFFFSEVAHTVQQR